MLRILRSLPTSSSHGNNRGLDSKISEGTGSFTLTLFLVRRMTQERLDRINSDLGSVSSLSSHRPDSSLLLHFITLFLDKPV